jgi:hypothetical protein
MDWLVLAFVARLLGRKPGKAARVKYFLRPQIRYAHDWRRGQPSRLAEGEGDRPLGRCARGAAVGDDARDEAVDLAGLLDLSHLPVPGRVDVGGGVEDVRSEDAVAVVGNRLRVHGLVELRPIQGSTGSQKA